MRSLLVLVVAVVIVGAGEVHAGPGVEKPSFTATPAELLAAGKAAARSDAAVTILRDETEISFDDRGRATHRWRSVFVVTTQGGVDNWGTLGHGWSPFYQDKPSVRARVIVPSGATVELDPSLISDAPSTEASPSVYSDRRNLKAPLPRLEIGAVVEEEIITKDREPILAAGTVAMIPVGGEVPVLSTHIVLSAPLALKARQLMRGLDAKVKPRHEVNGGRESWVFELGTLPATPDWESSVPGDVVVQPYIGMTTATSWAAVANSYQRVLDKRIADGPFMLPADLPNTPSIETARALAAWLHRQIRYTGIEFGEASNVPWPPAETVKRGFGDCKDKATLLVAILRQAGIRADLALLSTGPGRDIDPDLAGIDVFDHAIVRAQIAGHDVWIDATEDLFVVGKLPTRDQARRALVISPETTALVTTPRQIEASFHETRTIEIAESGAAHVVEVSRMTGVYDAELRQWVRDTRADDLRKDLAAYVKSEYRAAKLGSYTTSPPGDLARPFEMTLHGTDVNRAFTARDHVDVYLSPADALDRVPKLITAAADKQEPRKRDFEWSVPHVYEIENRLVLPPGYSVPAVTPEQTRKLGTATLVDRRRVEGQTLIVTFRFDTGKVRLTPAELAALQKAVEPVMTEEVHLVFENTAIAQADRGKPREAIAAVERVIKLHPKEALHQTELAHVLLRAGAGPAARRAARKAVELEPSNADAYSMLGWVLRNDTLGREFGFDHDRAGALAAYEKARKLDPKHLGAAIDHASLLEHDPEDLPVGSERDLSAAVEARRVALALDDSAENRLALGRILLRSGQAAEAEKVFRAGATSEVRDALLVAATAVGSGPAAAIALATSLRTGAARTTLIDAAASVLLIYRSYDASRALFAETGTLRPGTAQAVLIQRTSKHVDKLVVGKDPSKVPVDVMLGVLDDRYVPQSPINEAVAASVFKADVNTRRQLAMLRPLGLAFVNDFARSLAEPRVEGRPTGPWRVQADFVGRAMVVYVVLDRGVAKLVGGPDYPPAVASHVLRQLAANDLSSARQLLDWLRSDLDRAPGSIKATLAKFWGPGLPQDAGAASLAAAVMAFGSEPARAVPVLTKCSSTAADAQPHCDRSLAFALRSAKRWAELEKATAAWMQREPKLELASSMHASAVLSLGRFDEADKALVAHLAAYPDDRDARMAQVEAALARGNLEEATRRFEALVTGPDATRMENNNYAWFRILVENDLASALPYARAGAQDEKHPELGLNTLAVIEAELDDLGAAKTDGWKAMELRGDKQPDPADWYLVGRIQEQLGFREDAIAAYTRVKPTPDRTFPTSGGFAMRRLKLLGVAR